MAFIVSCSTACIEVLFMGVSYLSVYKSYPAMILAAGGRDIFDVIDCSPVILQTYPFNQNFGKPIYDKTPPGIHATGSVDIDQRLRRSSSG